MTRNLLPSTYALALFCALSTFSLPPCQAQTFTVLHSFTGGGDGGVPAAGLTMDQTGNLYGTTGEGGYTGGQCSEGFLGCGVVFKLTRKNSQWVLETLYTFHGSDGQNPGARVIFGPDGALYSTTRKGGAYGYGLVFRLAPPAHICPRVACPWTETILHSFTGGSDGGYPGGDLTFDRAGNIYGTASIGGDHGSGLVYELSPANGGWSESILYSFGQNANDGTGPASGVIFVNAGNLYGTTLLGGLDNMGTAFELTHLASGWTESILHHFTLASGCTEPSGGLIFDSAGNLYGTTLSQVATYELSPSNGGWIFTILYHFNVATGSFASMTMDAAGNLYGTLAFAEEEVFRLTPSDGQWTLTGFDGGPGSFPSGSVILDVGGNIYTTTEEGCGAGCVFEITP